MKNLYIMLLAVSLVGCNENRVFTSDVDRLIENQTKSTESILQKMNSFVNKHGKAGFESQYDINKRFTKIHKDVGEFLDSLNAVNKKELYSVSNSFVDKTFSQFSLYNPLETTLTENTPLSLIKLQIVNLENLYIREWENGVTYRFDKFESVIIPDKLGFKKGEKITGRVIFVGYADDLKLNARVNGKEVDAMGFFAVNPADIKPGQKRLMADVSFPDTVYTSTIDLLNVE